MTSKFLLPHLPQIENMATALAGSILKHFIINTSIY